MFGQLAAFGLGYIMSDVVMLLPGTATAKAVMSPFESMIEVGAGGGRPPPTGHGRVRLASAIGKVGRCREHCAARSVVRGEVGQALDVDRPKRV